MTYYRRKMWWKNTAFNTLNRLNNLSRSRKIILGLFIILVFIYYIVPKLLGSDARNNQGRLSILHGGCLGETLSVYDRAVNNFDAVLNYFPPQDGVKNYPAYVGNGYIAVLFDIQSALHVRLNRALSLAVNFYPVVATSIEGAVAEEVDVLHMRTGIANKLKIFSTAYGCVVTDSKLYAHRSHPNLLIQEIKLTNPTSAEVVMDLDQVGESDWKDTRVTQDEANDHIGLRTKYSVTSGVVSADEEQGLHVAVTVATTTLSEKQMILRGGETQTLYVRTIVHYTKPDKLADVKAEMIDQEAVAKQQMQVALTTNPRDYRIEHSRLWEKIWGSGFSISYSRAAGALNGDKVNSTIYYVLSNTPAPLHNSKTSPELALELKKTLHYPDKCYSGHTSLHSTTLWADAVDEDSIARIVTTWIITFEKQNCQRMIAAGVEGVLQAMILSIGSLKFANDHLEMGLHPKDTHRDFHFHRINYGNNTHLNITISVGDDNKANIFVALDRNDKPYYACDAGCLDPPVPLSKVPSKFPVKLTEPLTSILYITADKIHMEEYKHAIHVKEIAEAPAHEHHVIALHRHGHHFGGLPTIFWVSIAFLIIVFHLFLFKLIYNEYCQASERFTKSRYNV